MRTPASTARAVQSMRDAAAETAEPAVIALTGDAVECARALRAMPQTESFADLSDVWGRHRAAVVGVDLSALAARVDVRPRLRQVADDCDELCRRLRRLEHVLLLVRGADATEPEDLRRECDTAARRIHARLEQECGRSVVVTAILVDGCDDYAVLADRVVTRSRQAESLDVRVALLWEEIARSPIGAVAANDYL